MSTTTQNPAPAQQPQQTVPTTKIIAIGSLTEKATPANDVQSVLLNEVPATVRLYLQGKIDQWYFRTNVTGVVFIMNTSTVEEAHALLEQLPLGVAGMMTFEFIPIGPLSPLAMLLD